MVGRPRKNPDLPLPPPETLGERLRAERERLGLTQVELASALEIAERAVQNYEQDRNAIRMSVLERLRKIGIDVDFVVYGRDPEALEPLDQALWDRVVAWSDANSRDADGRPLNDYARYQRITLVYRWLRGCKDDQAEFEERLSKLPGSKAA
jgi:transcriptional regulator with XRE-family HTH domain